MELAERTDASSVFWDDLAQDMQDPDFLREYVVESVRIATIDDVVNALDEAREAAGISKAGLARAIRVEPAVMRRLIARGHVHPTLGTLAEVAAALGLRVALERIPVAERKQVTEPLLLGRSADTRRLAEHLSEMRQPRRGKRRTALTHQEPASLHETEHALSGRPRK